MFHYCGREGRRHSRSRFRASSVDPLTIDLSKEEVIISWVAGGHNGGAIQFGPKDGLLYISTGDSGPAFPPDPKMTGQDVSDLMASMLRIDVDHPAGGLPYSIPEDNPFVDLKGARGEVWSYGHRNPWRISLDPETNDLWVGDVGWELWEMIYRVKPGDNYGWSILEHTQAVHPERPRGPTPIVPPTVAHSHTESRSITGGHVYRGSRIEELYGSYIYGDYVTGKLWGVEVKEDSVGEPRELANSSIQVICFGVDHDRELYVVGYGGTVNRFVPNPEPDTSKQFPKSLAATGLFSSIKEHELAPGVIPYGINAEPWEDGTVSTRFLALPGESTIGVHTENNVQKGNLRGEWSYPDGTVIGKTISIDMDAGEPEKLRRLETQILHRHAGGWHSYSYAWNEAQTDAVLGGQGGYDLVLHIADEEAEGGIRKQTRHYAGRTECLLCHTTRGGSVYGFKIDQLNREFDYGKVTDNQLRTLAHIGVFEEPLAKGALPDRGTNRRSSGLDKSVRLQREAGGPGASLPSRQLCSLPSPRRWWHGRDRSSAERRAAEDESRFASRLREPSAWQTRGSCHQAIPTRRPCTTAWRRLGEAACLTSVRRLLTRAASAFCTTGLSSSPPTPPDRTYARQRPKKKRPPTN